MRNNIAPRSALTNRYKFFWLQKVIGFVGLSIFLLLIIGLTLRLYKTETHEHLNRLGAELIENTEEDSSEDNKVYREIYDYASELKLGGIEEDEPWKGKPEVALSWMMENNKCDVGRFFQHFYHPENSQGLLANEEPSNACMDALKWARNSDEDLTWTGAIETYGYSVTEKSKAYRRLGHVAHLIGDMAQPEHVHLEPHTWGINEKWVQDNWDQQNLQPDLTNLEPQKRGSMESHLREMAAYTYDISSFSGGELLSPSLDIIGIDQESEFGRMFDVFYSGPPLWDLPFWTLRNKTNLQSVGQYTGNRAPFSVGQEWQETSDETDAISSGEYFIIEATKAVPKIFTLIDGSTIENINNHPLAYFYSTELLPKAVEYIAGLYQYFFEVVNSPPYVSSISVRNESAQEDDSCILNGEWRNIIVNSTVTMRERESDCGTSSGSIGIGETVSIRLYFGGKLMRSDVVVKIGPQVIPGILSTDQFRGSYWEGSYTIPTDGSLFGEQIISVTGTDKHPHLDGRNYLGDTIDSDPKTVARAHSFEPYDWTGYEPGTDSNFKITIQGAYANVGFSASPLSGTAPLDVQFTDTSSLSEPVVAWVWDFGDGSTSDLQDPNHIYSTTGFYDVSLRVSSGAIESSITKSSYIHVTEEQQVSRLNLWELENVEVGQSAYLTVSTFPKQSGIQVGFSVADPTMGSIRVINGGITNSNGAANAWFDAAKIGSTTITANGLGYDNVSKTVTVVPEASDLTVAMTPLFQSGDTSSSHYTLRFDYLGDWDEQVFTISTTNGTWDPNGSNVYSRAFRYHRFDKIDITVSQAVTTSISLDFSGGTFNFTFVPVLPSGVTLTPFRTIVETRIYGVDWSAPGDELVFSAGKDIVKYNVNSWTESSQQRVNGTGYGNILAMKLSHDGSKIAYGDGEWIRTRTYSNYCCTQTSTTSLDLGHDYFIEWSNDDSHLAVSRYARANKLFRSSDLAIVSNLSFPAGGTVEGMDFRPKSNHFATAIENLSHELYVYGSPNGSEIARRDIGEEDEGTDVSYSPDGIFLAASEKNSVVKIYDASNGYSEHATLTGDWQYVFKLEWNRSTELNVLAIGTNNSVQFYDLDTSTPIFKTVALPSPPLRMEWSPDGSVLAVALESGNGLYLYSPFDQVPPAIGIIAPPTTPFSTRETSIEIRGVVEDASGISSTRIQHNGGAWTDLTLDIDGVFFHPVQLVEGTNSIVIEATDLYLNHTSQAISIIKEVKFLIEGTIVDDSADPVEGIAVSLSGSQNQGTQTTESGYYSFTVPGGGDYTVTPSDQLFVTTPTSISLTDVASNQRADFIASPVVFTVEGYVRDSDGNPRIDIQVRLGGSSSGTVITNDQGYYSFSSLLPGEGYTVFPDDDSYNYLPVSWSVSDLNKDWSVDFSGTLTSFTKPGQLQAALLPDGTSASLSWAPSTGSGLAQYATQRRSEPLLGVETIGYYPFDGTEAPTSGGSVYTSFVADSYGVAEGALGLTGNGYVETALSPSFGPDDSFSIGFWMKTDGSLLGRYILGFEKTQAQKITFSLNNEGEVQFQVRDDQANSAAVRSLSPLTDNSWHHVIAIRDADSNTLRLYMDGILQEEGSDVTSEPINQNEPLSITIGANHHLSTVTGHFQDSPFAGALDEVFFLRGVLSDSDISRMAFSDLAALNTTSTSQTETDLEESRRYIYRVLSIGEDGSKKGYSNHADITVYASTVG